MILNMLNLYTLILALFGKVNTMVCCDNDNKTIIN